MDITQIQDLIKFVAKSGVNEVEIEKKDFKITIKTESKAKKGQVAVQQVMAQPVHVPVQTPVVAAPVAAAPAAAPAAPAAANDEGNYDSVRSPMIGTFYRASGPDKPPFIGVGDKIKKGQVICVIEAMKLFNEIESEVDGTVVKVLVEDSKPVEYDQPLFLIEPAG